MVRDWKSIHKLQALEDRGYCVVNSGYGIENCTREKMTRLLLDEGLISLVEYDKLVAVNSDIFYPFLHGIMR